MKGKGVEGEGVWKGRVWKVRMCGREGCIHTCACGLCMCVSG